jgi:hypothetical protein
MAAVLPTTPPPGYLGGIISDREVTRNPMAASSALQVADSHATLMQKRRRTTGGGIEGCDDEYRERRKKVRFSTNNELREVPYEDDPGRSWFRNEELLHFRSRGKVLAMEISTTHQADGHCLSYKNVIEGTYRQAVASSARFEPDTGLLVWVQHGHSRRGLERWSVPSIGWYRHDRRHCLIRSIIFVQRNNVYDKDMVLRQLSEHYSAPGARFALAIAAADAHAVAATEFQDAETECLPNVRYY